MTEIVQSPAWADALPQGVSVCRFEHHSSEWCSNRHTIRHEGVVLTELELRQAWQLAQQLAAVPA